jgi:hypothetical protein
VCLPPKAVPKRRDFLKLQGNNLETVDTAIGSKQGIII